MSYLLDDDAVNAAVMAAIRLGSDEMKSSSFFRTPHEVFLPSGGNEDGVDGEVNPLNFIGSELIGTFKVTSYLKGGAFGQGWRAEICREGEHHDVFVKTMRCIEEVRLRGVETKVEIEQKKRNMLEAVRKEVQVVADARITQLQHENIATPLVMYGNVRARNGVNMDMFFIVSELCAAGMLCEYLIFRTVDNSSSATSFSEDLARFFVHQLVEGVAYMHENGMTHRDLKLENLVLTDTFQLKIIDFGAAKFDTDAVATSSGVKTKTILGTDIMFPPELRVNTRYYNPRAMDVWCVGVIAFFLIAMEYLRQNGKDFDFFTKVISRRCRSGWLSVDDRVDGVPQNRLFWDNLSGLEISDWMKQFLNSIFDLDPNERVTITELQEHEWLLLDYPSQEEVEKAMTSRNTRATVRERVVDLPGLKEFVDLCSDGGRDAVAVIQSCIQSIYGQYAEDQQPSVVYENAIYWVSSEGVDFFSVLIDDYSLRCQWLEGTLSNWLNFVHGLQRELDREYENMT
eukprot:m.38217 g.38217  ORF g.38217 m.38217 type:complete len:513 (-) comp10192_c0_seq1:142-1680(-)